MPETVYRFNSADKKLIERIVDDANVNINHMVLPQGAAMPEHFSNSNVYLIVVRGEMTLRLGEEAEQAYPAGSIVNVPFNVKMNIGNTREDVLEFFVVKAPHPKDMQR
ncbi:MAG: cupin domain-containing protein [bacterium]|jgi:quercetin dioxygenase-like cupin family protein